MDAERLGGIVFLVVIGFVLAPVVALMWHLGIRVVADRRMQEPRKGPPFKPPQPQERDDPPPLELEIVAAPGEPQSPGGRELFDRGERARRAAAAIYLLASIAAACVLAWCEWRTGGRVMLALSLAWPATLTVAAVAIPSFRTRLFVYALTGVAMLLLMWAVAGVASWIVFTPTFVLMLVANRWLKTIAPLLVVPSLVATFAAVFAVVGWRRQEWIDVAVAGLVMLFLALLFLSAVVVAYRRKLFSDLWFQLAFLWVLFILWYAAKELGEIWWAAFAAIAAYGITTFLTVAVVRRKAHRHAPVELLVLRAFGDHSRMQFFEEITARWRYVGPVHLIVGPDSVIANLDITELSRIMTMRSRGMYVNDKDDVLRRVEKADTRPDPDGRYRVNDFFCFADTWRPTFTQLLVRSKVVLVDLTGYRPANQGVAFELAQLLARRALGSFVLIIDESTNVDHLHATLMRVWRELDPSVPNATLPYGVVRVLDRPRPRDVVAALCDAAAVRG